MKKLIVFILVAVSVSACKAQYRNNGNDQYYDGYSSNAFADDLTDWHLDSRIRISNGIANGRITNFEANRLYNELERIERKEYFYQEDGNFSAWEQDEIWDDVIDFNRNLGIQLTDFDRVRFGYDIRGFNRVGYGPWFYAGGFDFYRFDNWGFGNRRVGYIIPNNACSYRYDHRNRSNHYTRNSRIYTDNRNDNRNNPYRNTAPRGADRSTNGYNNQNSSRGNSERVEGRSSSRNGSNKSSDSRYGNSATRENSRVFDSRTNSERGSMSGERSTSTRSSSGSERSARPSQNSAPRSNGRTESAGTERSSRMESGSNSRSETSTRSTRRN